MPTNVSGGRVLWVVHYPVFGGPHNEALLLAEPLAALGWETEVLIPDEQGNAGDRLEQAGIRVERMPLARVRASASPSTQLGFVRRVRDDVRRIQSLLRDRHVDLVVVGGLVNPQAALAARREGVGVVWKVLDTRAPAAIRTAMTPFLLACADVAMTTGRRVAAVHPGLSRLGSRLVSYYPPVDLARFRPDDEARRSARAELGIAEADVVVGTVGNLSPMKRHGDFVLAAASVHATHPATCFVILGAAYSERREYVESLFSSGGDRGLTRGRDLIIADPGSRVTELAPAFDLFWLSSDRRSEGVPTAVGEAMALGLPVVATDVGGVPEVVEDGRTGFVVSARSPEALAAATRPLLDDASMRASFGAAGRERAHEFFALERCAETHDGAFHVAWSRSRVRRAGSSSMHRLSEREREGAAFELSCPICRGPLARGGESAHCETCGRRYPIVEGIPILVPDQDDPHKREQAAFFDRADRAFEVSRPHGTPLLYQWLLGQKFARSVSGIDSSIGGGRVLTVCGGSGMDAEFLARAGGLVVASDISLEAARRTRERARRFGLPIEVVVADVERLPFPDRSFDLVYVHDGLHHLERPVVGLREMARVSARAVSINEPARATATRIAVRLGFSYDVEDAGNSVERIDPAELAGVLREEGFTVVRTERYAMYYRHVPGRIFRALSTEPVFATLKLAFRIFNRVAGRIGNKSTIQAVRSGTPAGD